MTLVIGALLFWISWYWPRTTFWISIPLILIVALIMLVDEKNPSPKIFAVMLICASLGWGWWAHTTALDNIEYRRQQQILRQTMRIECRDLEASENSDPFRIEMNLFRCCPEAEGIFKVADAVGGEKRKHSAADAELAVAEHEREIWKILTKAQNVASGNGTLKDVPPGEYTLVVSAENSARRHFWVMRAKKTEDVEEVIPLSTRKQCLSLTRSRAPAADAK